MCGVFELYGKSSFLAALAALYLTKKKTKGQKDRKTKVEKYIKTKNKDKKRLKD